MNGSKFQRRGIVPVGTQVVLQEDVRCGDEPEAVRKAGSVAVVAALPEDAAGLYTLRCVNGLEFALAGSGFVVRKRLAPDRGFGEARDPLAFEPFLILRAAMGSTAYGLATEGSDVDEKGIFLPPAEWTWSLREVPEQVEFKRVGDDFCWWEIEKFMRLALRANPSALELMFVGDEHVLGVTDVGRELLSVRECFLSKFIYQTYSGYALSQFRRMQRAREAGKEPRAKHAMHLVRLLLSGIAGLRSGVVVVDASEHRDELLAIKEGRVAFDAVHARALELDLEFQRVLEVSPLPDAPDTAEVDDFLVRARRSAV